MQHKNSAIKSLKSRDIFASGFFASLLALFDKLPLFFQLLYDIILQNTTFMCVKKEECMWSIVVYVAQKSMKGL